MVVGYEQAWSAYSEALGELYGAGPAELADRGAGDLTATGDLEARAERLIERSGDLGDAAAEGLNADDRGVRELAELQLVSGAALDLITAADLMRVADGDQLAAPGEAERGGSELPAATQELQAILSTPQAAGIHALIGEELERGGGPSSVTAARQHLETAVEDALNSIVDDAGKGGSAVIRGLLEMAAPPLSEAAGAALHELAGQLGSHITGLLRKAARLVVRAIEKIFRALGPDVEREARKEATGWVDQLKEGKALSAVLTWLYEAERIKTDVSGVLVGDTADAGELNRRADAVTALAAHFARNRKVVQWLARGLALIRTPVMAILPWGPPVLVAAHVASLGYIGFLGGNYAGWYRGERLDVVLGVRKIACGSV